ncbi:hypothetical protein AAHH17_08700 [Lysinibacillus capsici]|uniref:beta strand repeat-containing protein n=1 Tax=Lysinibacillus capsici TaxID=2115968 RepID=UPI0032E37F0B
MKKGLQLSAAAVIALSAITPVATAAAAEPTAQQVKPGIYTTEGYTSIADFKKLTTAKKAALLQKPGAVLVVGTDVIPTEVILTGTNDDLENSKVSVEKYQEDNKVVITEDGIKPVTPEETVTVSLVSAINDTSIEVTFGKDVEVKAEDLAGKTITLTAGETTLTGTFAAGSLSNGKAVFNLAEGEKLVDATVYTLASEAVSFDVNTFTAKVANAYAATFTTETTAITASTEAELAATTTRTFKVTAKDQYGEDFTLGSGALSVVGSTINGMPLIDGTGEEIAITADGTVTIKRSLVEGDKLAIKVSSKDGDKVLGTTTIEFTVTKATSLVPTSVAGVKATVNGTVPTAVVAGETVTLTPDVRDQNNTAISADVRYVVTAGADLLSAGSANTKLGNDLKTIDKASSGSITFEAVKPGTVTIDVFNVKNGAKYTYTVEVGAKKLATITNPTSASGFNNEEIKTAAVTATAGAAFTPEMIKFNITDANGNATTDVNVTAQYKGGTGNDKNDIILVAKTTKAGSYKVTPYVGESFTAAEAVKGQTLTVTTTLNPVATAIDTITVGAVKVNTPVTKEIVVRNKHNEDITKEVLNKISFDVYKDGAKVDLGVTVSDPTLNETTKKYEVKFNATADGDYTVRAYVEGSAAAQDIAVSAEVTKLSSINLGQDIYEGVISNDDAYYQIITAKDNKGDNILPTGAESWTVKSKIGSDAENTINGAIQFVKKNDKGVWVESTGHADAEAIALKVDTKDPALNNFTADKTVTYTVSTAVDSTTVTDSINVKVKSKRAVSTIEVAPATVQAGLGATATVKVTPKDQYGKVVADLDVSAFNITSSDDGIVNDGTVSGWTAKGADGKSVSSTNPVAYYEFTVNTVASGTAQLTIAKATDATVKSVVNVTVAPASDLVKSFTITGANIENGTPKYKVNNSTTDLKLSVDAKDANGNSVAVKASDIIWTSNHASLQVANDGTVTVDTSEISGDAKNQEVTVTAEVFGVEQTIKFVVSKEDAVAQPGTFVLKQAGSVTDLTKVDGDAKTAGIQIYLDGKNEDGEAEDGTIVLTYNAVDQFGKLVSLAGTATSYNTEIATVSAFASETITVTPVKAGSTKVSAKLPDNQTVVLDIIVTEENAKVIANKADSQATTDANAFKATHATILGKTIATVAIEDKAALTLARNAYDGLSAEVKAKLTVENTLLLNLANKIAELEADNEATTAANTFKTTHATILGKTTATVAIEDKTALTLAQNAYTGLSAETKAKLTVENTLLGDLANKIAELEADADDQAVTAKSTDNTFLDATYADKATAEAAIKALATNGTLNATTITWNGTTATVTLNDATTVDFAFTDITDTP